MNISRQLSERITETIENIPSGFRAIDKDKLLNDIRNLYDKVLEMETSVVSTIPAPEPIIKEQPETAAAPAATAATQPAMEAKPETEVEIFETEPVAEPQEKVVEEISPEPIAINPTTEPQTDSDTNEGTLAGKLNQKPIADLRTGIPLNEKFSFVQNLFQNNASDYADAILKLNNAENQTTAIEYFERKANRRGWDMEDAQVRSFKNYIERRHLVLA